MACVWFAWSALMQSEESVAVIQQELEPTVARHSERTVNLNEIGAFVSLASIESVQIRTVVVVCVCVFIHFIDHLSVLP